MESRPGVTNGRILQEKWDIEAKQALYHHEGSWYQVPREFPAVLFDFNGYVRFETANEYLNSPDLLRGKQLNFIGKSKLKDLPSYVPFPPEIASEALAILRYLVDFQKAGGVKAGLPQTYVTYGKVHGDLGLDQKGSTIGNSLSWQGLRELAEWIKGRGLPAITGLIVEAESRAPSQAYFDLYKPVGDPYVWWEGQINASLKFDWSKYLPAPVVPAKPSPLATDLGEPPARVKTTTYRILRDTELAQRVKRDCGYRCQICTNTITLPDGSLYVEAHHIKPLGAPHAGPDDEANIICVCPNHHAELDFGVIRLDRTKLTGPSRHTVGDIFISYHNDSIFEVKAKK